VAPAGTRGEGVSRGGWRSPRETSLSSAGSKKIPSPGLARATGYLDLRLQPSKNRRVIQESSDEPQRCDSWPPDPRSKLDPTRPTFRGQGLGSGEPMGA
jgi:hypothetical protein